MLFFRSFISLCLGIFLSSCQSPLSEGNLNDLSAMDVRIEIAQDLTNKRKNEITVFIYDENGKPVRNKAVSIKVNGHELPYQERQELYYTTSSKYSVTDIPVVNEYDFQISLSDGKTYFLGKIAPLSEHTDRNIVCADKGDFTRDFLVSWKDLKDIDRLSVTKGVLLSNSTAQVQNHDFEPQVNKKIGPNGIYMLSKSAYISSKSTISSLELKFSATKHGVMNPQLLKGSEIWVSGHIDRYVEFDAQQ